jgi:hypothetical protein
MPTERDSAIPRSVLSATGHSSLVAADLVSRSSASEKFADPAAKHAVGVCALVFDFRFLRHAEVGPVARLYIADLCPNTSGDSPQSPLFVRCLG